MWGAIEADMHREYGVDMSAPGVLRAVTWRWFVVRLSNLSPDSMVRTLARARQSKGSPQGAMQALAGRAAAGPTP